MRIFQNNMNFLSQFYEGSGNIRNWTQFKNDYDLSRNFYFICAQLYSKRLEINNPGKYYFS